jgi:hypothetical protein
MLPNATNFLNPCLCESAAFLRGAGVAEWLFANDFRACVNFPLGVVRFSEASHFRVARQW